MSAFGLNALALFFAASVHEDVAVLTAAYFVLEQQMPVVTALAAVWIGSVLNSYAIYGLGKLARRLPGLRRWLISDKIERVRQRIKRHLVSTMIVCRIIPGSLSPFLLGCGWLGVPFSRFAVTVALTAAAHVALFAALVFTVGQNLMQQLMSHPWLVGAAIAALLALLAVRYSIGMAKNEA